MKYAVLESNEIGDLVDAVNDYIADGWKPLGGIAVAERGAEDHISFLFVQAMISE